MLPNVTLSSAKCLGVKITHDLEWGQHIIEIISKATKTLSFLCRNLTFASKETKTAAYKSLVRLKLENAAPLVMSYNQVGINRIEILQRTATHWCNQSARKTAIARPARKTTAGFSVSILQNTKCTSQSYYCKYDNCKLKLPYNRSCLFGDSGWV